MAKLFVAILIIVVLEGAVRKWISPSFTYPLVVLRDCLALYGMFWAISRGKFRTSRTAAQILWLWSAAVVLWGLLQLMVNQNSLVVFIMGIRFWLLYLWFAYAAAVSLTAVDFRYITRCMLWILLAMVPLAVVQFYLPPSAFINKNVGDGGFIFVVTADIVRTTGTFSFTLGYTIFLAFVTPFVLAQLTPGSQLWGRKWMPKVIFLVLAVGTMVSGSRGALVMFGVLFLAYVFIVLRYAKTANKGGTVFMLAGVFMILAMVPYVLSRAVDATQQRFISAAKEESLPERVRSMFFGEVGIYENLSLIGEGVGSGNNFAGVNATGERTFLLAETEAARTILEGGILGFVFIGLKLLLITLGVKRSFSIAKKTGNCLPLLLWITLGVGLLTWSIIGQLTVNALGYLLLGLGIASLRLSVEPMIGNLK